MKLLLKLLAAVILLLVVAVLALPMILSGDWVKAKVETAASDAVGRDVTLAGNPKISVFPPLVKVEGLNVANAEGFSAPHLLAVESASLGVKLGPLLKKEIELTEFNLNRPNIRLQVAENGDVNWALGTGNAAPQPEQTGGDLPVADISLGDVNISDGTIIYEMADGQTYTATDADLTLTLTSLDDPLRVKGDLVLQDEPASLDATMTTPRSFITSKAADLALAMKVGSNKADTTLKLADPLSYEGSLDIDVPALRSLIALAGASIEAEQGFERVRLKGNVSGDADTLAFAQGTEVTFDDITGTGSVTIELSGTRPKISGAFASPKIDVTPYLPAAAPAGPGKGSAFPAWSTDPMDFSALQTVDLDLDLSAGEIILPNFNIGKSAVAVQANAGQVVATLKESQLYGGTGSGTVSLDARAGRTVRVAPKLVLTDVNVGDVASDLTGMTRLIGKGNVNIDVVTTGNTQALWVDNLTGDVGVDLDKGKLEGVNLGKIARGAYETYQTIEEGGFNIASIQQSIGALTTQARGPAEETDFSEMEVGLGLDQGAALSRKINITGPYFTITGDAAVNLPLQEMRMTLTPSVSAIEGDAKRTLPIPILISGTFNSPKIGLDTAPLIKGAATKGVTDLLKKQGIAVPEGAESVQDTLKGAARNELGKLLQPKGDEGTEENGETGKKDTQDELLKLGIGAILGTQDSQTSEDPDPEGGEEAPQ